MASEYEELDWTCQRCTVFNSYASKKCSVCGTKNLTKQNEVNTTTNKFFNLYLNSSNNSQNKNKLDSNNNSTPDSKYADMIKSAFNNITNDVKHFFNGFSPSNNNNNNNNNNNSHTNDDVIEIDPKTNKPVRVINTNVKKDLNRTFNQWTCDKCTFAANALDKSQCEICGTAKNVENNVNPYENVRRNGGGEVDTGLTVYDTSLNGDIYEYARIWTCKQCTFINFEKDKKCELCLAPREQHQNGTDNAATQLLDLRPRTSKNGEESTVTSDSWVCKACTYFNSNKSEKCSLCASSRNKFSQKEKQKEWSCPICSHKNSASRELCDMCSHDPNSEPMDYEDVDAASHKGSNQYDNLKDDAYYPKGGGGGGVQFRSPLPSSSSSINSRASTLSPSLTYRSQKAKSTVKTYANATSQAERFWNSIVNYCKEQGHKFVDDSFPPCDKSLFIGSFFFFHL
jgi:ribosomal protein L40E